jgi:hypothetical protein
MTITQLAAWVMLAFGGLFSGAILVFAVERVNLWRRMPVDQYVVDFRRSLYRADPLILIMGILSALGPGSPPAARRPAPISTGRATALEARGQSWPTFRN